MIALVVELDALSRLKLGQARRPSGRAELGLHHIAAGKPHDRYPQLVVGAHDSAFGVAFVRRLRERKAEKPRQQPQQYPAARALQATAHG